MEPIVATEERADRVAPGRIAADAPALTCRRLRRGESALYRALRFDGLTRCPEYFGVTYEEEAKVPTLEFESAIEAGTRDRFVVGAFCGQHLIGLAGFARRVRRKMSHRGDISQVYVDPARRGLAVGSNLMRWTLALAFELPGIEQVELTVVSTNTAAVRLYQRLGFVQFGLQENYFKVGELRWNMCLMQLSRARYLAGNRPASTARSQHA